MRIGIKHKLFLTLMLTSCIVVAGMFGFMQWSFDRGFLEYVNTQELERLDEMVVALSMGYAEHGDWEFLRKNHELWHRYTRPGRSPSEAQPGELRGQGRQERRPPPHRQEDGFGERPWREGPGERLGEDRRRPPEPGDRREGDRPPPPPADPREISPRVVLLDADREKIIGPLIEGLGELHLRPITFGEKTIGYLGLLPAGELADAGDLLFVEQQSETFAFIALAMVAVSLLLGLPLINHLLVPIKALTRGTGQLTAGQYRLRIPVTSQDELGQLSRDFNILALTLEKNEKIRKKWVADISHELRTPLAVLRGEIEAIQDGVREATPQALEALHGEVLHLTRLVGDLYELSASDIGALSYKKVELDPVGVLEGVVELFRPRLAQKGIILDDGLPQERSVTLLADPDRLQQLFTNLLENSLRYTDGEGKVEVGMEQGRGSVVFNVMDSAPTVPQGHLPKLFDYFYRVDESRSRARGGAGLGLAICKNIVEAHQGRIEARPSPLGGLWIRVEFPLKVRGVSNGRDAS